MHKDPGRLFLHGLIAALLLMVAGLTACSPQTSRRLPPLRALNLRRSSLFTTQPVGAEAGTFFATQPVVAAVDTNGNVVAGPRILVTLAITGVTPDSHISLFGGTTVTSLTGTFIFKELSIDNAGTFTLTATSSGLTPAVSAPLVITSIHGARLVFSGGVVGAPAGAALAAQPVVTVLDMYGNPSQSSTAEVILSMTNITPESFDATLSGITKVKAVNGTASFAGLSIDRQGTYALLATSGNLLPVYSNAFDIKPAAGVKLFFNTQPQTAAVGSPLTVTPPSIAVLVQDPYGNTDTSSSAEVTITITPNTGSSGAVLSGTKKIKAANGVINFGDLSIDKVGTGYTLTAASAGLQTAVSDLFDITPPAPAPASSNTTAP